MVMTQRSTLSVEMASLPQDRSRALRIVAKSVYKELRSQGFDRSDVVAFASAMVSLISDDIRADSATDADS